MNHSMNGHLTTTSTKDSTPKPCEGAHHGRLLRGLRALLVGLLSLSAVVLPAAAADSMRVFIRAGVKTHGPNQHDHPRFLGEWTQLLGERGLKVDGAMEFPTAEQLEATDVIIIYAADGMKITGDQRADFEKFLARGGGVLVLHDGVVGGGQHEWVKKVVGGAWRWPDSTLAKEKATKWLEGDVGVYWVDDTHPITRGLSNFDWKDEIYYDMDMAPDAGVLATSFHNVHIIAPQIWTYEKTWEGGSAPYRSVVSLPGHEFDVFKTPQYRAVLLRALAWVGKKSNVDEWCRPEELASLQYPPGGPRPGNEQLKTLLLHPEFNVTLAADERVAQKIMSLDWDPRGRLWVVETPEYPNGRDINRNDARISPWRTRDPGNYPVGAKEPRPGRDRVSILEDTDNDGLMDKKTVFADGLELPTSLVFYKDGVIVSQAPETLWIRDTDGDGTADKTEVLFTGWGTFDTHAVTSNLRWGIDGWIYGSVGYSSGDVKSGDGSKAFGRITAGIYRFRPDGSALEQVAAGSCNTWGCEIAPDGEVFFTTATCGEPILHVVMPEKSISRAGVPGIRAAKPIIEENKVFPPRHETRQPYVQIDWVGAWTAASGSTIYDGGAWPGKWNGPSWSFFLHEPTVWLTHHEFLDPAGVSYQGRREEGRKDTHFFMSTDYWFKPIHSHVGPDGALYVVDFYNQIAVHNDTRGPAHGAHNAATRPDRDHKFTRLWRIQHKQAKTLPSFELKSGNPTKLVEMLDHPNGWVRATANRLLREGAGRNVLAALENKTLNGANTYGRINALWVLQNLGALEGETILAAINDDNPVVRRNGIRAAIERGPRAEEEAPIEVIRARLNDSDPRTRLLAFQGIVNLTLTREIADLVVEAWPTLKDRYLEAAALSATAADPLLYLEAALAARDPAFLATMVPQLARQIGNRNDPALARAAVLSLAGKPASVDNLKASALGALAASLKADVQPSADEALGNALKKLLASETTAGAALPFVARWNLASQAGDAAKAAIARTESQLSDKGLSDDERGQIALNLLGVRALDSGIVPAVAGLIGSGDASAALQRRVIEALGNTGDAGAGRAMLGALPTLDFDLREMAFGQLLKRADWSAATVQALADGKIDPRLLGPANLHRLRTHADKSVATRAASVIDDLKGPEQKEKETLIAGLRAEAVKPGNAANGAKLYTQNCAVCHKYKDEGAEFAPNLTGMGAHGPEDLLIHILDPNRVVEPNFIATSIETKDDMTYDGIILRENNTVVVLRNQTAETEIRKDNIQSRRSTGRSLMPEGFEQLGVEGLRDMLTYLCADDLKYRILDMSAAFTANSTRGIYMTAESRDESLRFRKWGTIQHRGIPFDIVNPARTPTGNNLVVLQGGAGMSRTYPKEVEIKAGLQASRLHFLSGVAGWGYPLGEKDQPVARVVVHFAGGAQEEFVLRNGVEFADYIAKIDVPGSEALADLDKLLMQGRQLRYFNRALSKKGPIEKVVLSSYATGVAPTFVAVTAELGEPVAGAQAAAAPASAPVADRPKVAWGSGRKVLLIGGGASHDYNRWFNLADVALLNGTGRMSAAYFEPPDLSVETVRSADVLLISANKAFPDPEVRKAIFAHADAGKGIVLLHPGLWYNWPNWSEFNRELAGGGSRGHDSLGEFDVVVQGADHPLLKGVPAKFTITDELYWFEPAQGGTPITVLATAQSKAKNKAFPQVFTVNHPKTRIAGITLGHDGRAHSLDAYKTLLVNAVDWVSMRP
ncbi:MAG: PVC-type heme-binding CxxCH protein [Limisphaerales bacterium]